jgi:aryl-alcohol dehydrogenase-like predicted oxidoreductase
MKDTMLGHTGLGVSRICLGCVIHGVAGLGAHMPEKMGVKAAHVPNAVAGF